MTLRRKLLLLYTTMFGLVLILGAGYVWVGVQWQSAAREWQAAYDQAGRADLLKSVLFRQAGFALDHLAGEPEAGSHARELSPVIDRLIRELQENAASENERGHIESLEESRYELNWILDLALDPDVLDDAARRNWSRGRLRELTDETADDVTALTQQYHAQVDRRLEAASRTSDHAETGTVVVLVLLLSLVLILILLLRRWLVRPIGAVVEATREISEGRFETRLDERSGDEWSHLGHAVNRMAYSLAVLNRQLRIRERLAVLGEAAAYTAHNIKNPLAGIRMTAQVTRQELTTRSQGVSDALDDIIGAVDRLDAWVARFLDFARPLELHPSSTDINGLVDQVTSLVRQRLSGKTLHLSVERSEPPLTAVVDAALIEQALHAIVSNACEAGASRVTVKVHTEGCSGHEPRLAIEVRDDGRGLSEKMQSELFLPFRTDKEGGTGLGLAQAKTIVDLHGGELTLESAAGSGTRVRICLPIDTGASRTAPEFDPE